MLRRASSRGIAGEAAPRREGSHGSGASLPQTKVVRRPRGRTRVPTCRRPSRARTQASLPSAVSHTSVGSTASTVQVAMVTARSWRMRTHPVAQTGAYGVRVCATGQRPRGGRCLLEPGRQPGGVADRPRHPPGRCRSLQSCVRIITADKVETRRPSPTRVRGSHLFGVAAQPASSSVRSLALSPAKS